MYRFLVIGGGHNSAAGRVHLSALSLNNHTSVVNGVFSRDISSYPINYDLWQCTDHLPFASSLELLSHYHNEASKPILLILAPTPNHFDLISQALSFNYSIICEKPICSDYSQSLRLKDLVSHNHCFLRSTFNYTGYPMIRELKARLDQQEIGLIQQIQIEMPQEGLVRPPLIQGESRPPQSWRLCDGSIPSVALDLGTHLYHLIYFLTDSRITPLAAHLSNHTSYSALVDTFNVLFTSEDHLFNGSMWFTKSALGNRNGLKIRIFGTLGSFEWFQMSPEKLIFSALDGSISFIDRGVKCLEANKNRYERMKAGHPSGFIEAFANTYCDILHDFDNHHCGHSSDFYKLGIDYSIDGLRFFQDAVDLAV